MEEQIEVQKKWIEGYEGLYEVYEDGQIYSYHRCMYLTHTLNSRGYMRVTLSLNGVPKKILVHRLLAKAFIQNPETKPYINHIDGNKLNNNLSNLEWCTAAENNKHAVDNNLYNKVRFPIGVKFSVGIGNHHHKLIDSDVIEIRNGTLPIKELALKYNVSTQLISEILIGNIWKHLPCAPKRQKIYAKQKSTEATKKIIELHKLNKSYSEISNLLEVNLNVVGKTIRKYLKESK